MAEAMQRCPECQSVIPATARRCAHCRHRILTARERFIRGLAAGIVLAVLLAVAFGAFLIWSTHKSEDKATHEVSCIVAGRDDC